MQAQIIEERRREFFLEGQRLGDIIRYNLQVDAGEGNALQGTAVSYGNDTGIQLCFPLPDIERRTTPIRASYAKTALSRLTTRHDRSKRHKRQYYLGLIAQNENSRPQRGRLFHILPALVLAAGDRRIVDALDIRKREARLRSVDTARRVRGASGRLNGESEVMDVAEPMAFEE